MGREFALLGNYEASLVYYQGVVQQIHRLLQSVNDPMRRERWQEVSTNTSEFIFLSSAKHLFYGFFISSPQIQQRISQEYEYVKDIQSILVG